MRTILRSAKALVASAALVSLVGCATYSQASKESLTKVRGGDYEGALKATEKQLSPEGDDRLLHYMETGVLFHLKGDYEASNAALEKAARIAEELYTNRVSDMLAVAMSNPRVAPYPGTDYERAYIRYYKALNYVMLGFERPGAEERYWSKAKIEARRMEVVLSALSAEKGTYKEAEDEKKQLFAKTLRVFDTLRGSIPDKALMEYREDAYLRYLNGVVYELSRDWDNARISYEKAARLYEGGYGEQYGLGEKATEMAWLDTARMLRRVGNPRWQRIAKEKLNADSRSGLNRSGVAGGQLVLIEHVDLLPPRGELNLWLRLDEEKKDFLLVPNLTGSEQERQDQLAWFSMLYADHGLADILYNYHQRKLGGVVAGTVTKRIPAAPVWDLVEELELPTAMGMMGIRVTVPYYRPYTVPYRETRVSVDGEPVAPLVTTASLHQAAYQDLLKKADKELHTAITREVFKRLVSHEATKGSGSALAKWSGRVATMATSAAETRACLTLPSQIRVQRYFLPPGTHQVQLTSIGAEGERDEITDLAIRIPSGGVALARARTIAPNREQKRVAARYPRTRRKP